MGLNRFQQGLSTLLLVAAVLSCAQAQARQPFPVRDVNSYLGNTVRTDVGGEGLWLPQLDSKLTQWLPPRPGFVGQVYYVHATALAGLFQYEFSDGSGAPLTPQVIGQRWTPAFTVARYKLIDGSGNCPAELVETKFITDREAAFSQVTVLNATRQPQTVSVRIVDMLGGRLAHRDESVPAGVIARKLVFNPTTYYFTDLEIEKDYLLQADGFWSESTALRRTIQLGQRGETRFTTRLIFGNEQTECLSQLAVLSKSDVLAEHVKEFNDWFAVNVPAFTCSDASYQKMYYYRWYLVKKCSINARRYVPDHPYPTPVMYEGVAGRWFTKVIGLPLPQQILEARWLNDKSLAEGQARTALMRSDFFDYLNWTPWAIWQLHLVAPNEALIRDALPAMRAFVAGEDAKDEDRDWLPTVWGSWITGMEYQPSFHYFTEPRWDHKRADEFITNDHLTKDPLIYRKYLSLERVDEATYYYLNNLALARALSLVGDRAIQREYQDRAANIQRSVLEKMWDSQTRFFYDVHPATHEKAIEAKTVDGFFPFLFGQLASASELALFDHLMNTREFWTPWPVPTVAQDCPAFDSHGYWKVGPNASTDKPYFYIDSWNGPTWMFSNALVLDALASASRMSTDRSLADAFNRLMKKHTEIQFLRRDPNLPCTVEHYDSRTGENIRLLADYFHSCYNDLLIRHMIGIVPREDGLIEIDPLVKGWRRFSIKDVRYRDHKISVSFDKRFTVRVDGKTVLDSPSIRRVIYDPRK